MAEPEVAEAPHAQQLAVVAAAEVQRVHDLVCPTSCCRRAEAELEGGAGVVLVGPDLRCVAGYRHPLTGAGMKDADRSWESGAETSKRI